MRLLVIFLALAVSPFSVCAQTYKCKQADGKVSFQDHVCQGNSGTKVDVRPAPVTEVSAEVQKMKANAEREKATSPKTQKPNKELEAKNQEIEAYNRSVRCNAARRNLGILKVERPVFRYDNKGEKQYVEDANRQAEINAAQRVVAEHCN